MLVGIAAVCLLSITDISIGQAEFRRSFVGKVLADVPVYMIASSLIYFFAIGKATTAAKFMEKRGLVFIGKRSYGAYVYHQVVNYTFYFVVTPVLLEPIFGMKPSFRGIVELCVFGAVTLLVATLSYKYIEQPIFRLRDRIFPTAR
jgi:peptidoglycan/LPS O-acetylase OafA/YrhL